MLEGKTHPAEDGAVDSTDNDAHVCVCVRAQATIGMLKLVGPSLAALLGQGPRGFK